MSVTLNDNSTKNCSEMSNHVQLNGFVTVDDISTMSDCEVQVTCQDANVILHQRQFHFMYGLFVVPVFSLSMLWAESSIYYSE